jgi:hypothetical protein
MTMTIEAFREKVEAFLERTGVAPSALGRGAVKDSKFVIMLRDRSNPRSPHLRTIEKVETWMRNWKPPKKVRKPKC